MAAAAVPTQGWGEVRAGLIVIGVITGITSVNVFLLGGGRTCQRLTFHLLGAGIFGLIGFYLLVAGVVHLL